MKVTFRAPVAYSPARMNLHIRQMLNDTGLPLPVEDAIAIYYYCLGLESMAFGIHWDVDDGIIHMEIPVANQELRDIYFSRDKSNPEPDGVSTLLHYCVQRVDIDHILSYLH